jgi:hypothetical protein
LEEGKRERKEENNCTHSMRTLPVEGRGKGTGSGGGVAPQQEKKIYVTPVPYAQIALPFPRMGMC